MNNVASYFLFFLSFALAVWTFLVWRGFSQNWLPPELATAKVAQVERTLFVHAPFRVVGRPDQVYRLPDGLHVPVECKNRDAHRVYETDVAQLSLQAWMLRLNGYATADFAFVAVNSRGTGRRKAIKVQLRDDAYCEWLIRRYIDVTQYRVQPRQSRGGKCNSCGYRALCFSLAKAKSSKL